MSILDGLPCVNRTAHTQNSGSCHLWRCDVAEVVEPLEDAIQRVRDLHSPECAWSGTEITVCPKLHEDIDCKPVCSECRAGLYDVEEVPYPCDTIRIMDGEQE